MTSSDKKNDKRLCWNCEGNVSHHVVQCPYCGVDVKHPVARDTESLFKGFASPFQNSTGQAIPKPPYASSFNKDLAVTEEEWTATLDEEKEPTTDNDSATNTSKRDMIALLLLLPGVVFFLFGLALTLFANEGVLVLKWNQDIAYLYFLGSVPLLYLGWRAFK